MSATYNSGTKGSAPDNYEHHIDRESLNGGRGWGLDNDSYDREAMDTEERFPSPEKHSIEENDYTGRKKASLTEVIVENANNNDKETLSEKDLKRIIVM